MRIGEVADQVGVQTQTIRFYERKGLLPQPPRGANGYRDYDDSALTTLRFIRNSQAAGLTLVEIATILDQRRTGTTPCEHVHDLLTAKLLDVQQRQRELAILEAELDHLLDRSRRLDPAECTDEAICHIIGREPNPQAHPDPRDQE
ncbi:MerR family transcriptional regulator [Nocardioides sp. Root122]|uniref:heavy metal-responsive transcriptional regulator n=1 Tax=Nocardioides TaxID=1839 RepID=UPI000703B9DD|nr:MULTISPECIES: heavy metal-responsive transcriptional regulator [Nocardioides]KQV63392.1 MerR family transcriptional regulator [Nocardioides sp. Root122]MCK9826052.1 heavy metal-responsive transcriptional regulator [Nocardioides cavernae]